MPDFSAQHILKTLPVNYLGEKMQIHIAAEKRRLVKAVGLGLLMASTTIALNYAIEHYWSTRKSETHELQPTIHFSDKPYVRDLLYRY